MTIKTTVTFLKAFLAEVDRIAQQEQRSRSELLREVMRVYIELHRKKTRPGDDPEVRAAVAAQDALSRKAPGTGQDSTLDIRRARQAH